MVEFLARHRQEMQHFGPQPFEQVRNNLTKLHPFFYEQWKGRAHWEIRPTLVPHITSAHTRPVGITLHDTDFCFVIGLHEVLSLQQTQPIGMLIASEILAGSLYCSTGEYLQGVYAPSVSDEARNPTLASLRRLNDNNGILIHEDHRGRGLSRTLFDAAMLLAFYTGSESIIYDRLNDTSDSVIKHLGYPIKAAHDHPQKSLTVQVISPF